MILGAFCVACVLAHGQLAITRPEPPAPPIYGSTAPVFRDGAHVGWYVDNEEPRQAELVAEHAAEGWPFVIAGIWPACDSHPDQSCGFPGAINAREFYPFGLGETVAQIPLGQSAYIIQWDFAWDGQPPPTKSQRWSLLCAARRLRPQFILFYKAEILPSLQRLKRACLRSERRQP